MAMGGGGGGGRGRRGRMGGMNDINVTPLIDVMLVLLVIFMVTAPLLQTGVQVDLPKAKSAPMQTDDSKLLVMHHRRRARLSRQGRDHGRGRRSLEEQHAPPRREGAVRPSRRECEVRHRPPGHGGRALGWGREARNHYRPHGG